MGESSVAQPLTASELAELRRLEAAATPGEWEFQVSNDDGLRRFGTPLGVPVARAFHSRDLLADIAIDDQDAALIVAARNALPRLLAQVEALTAENKRMREALWEIQRCGTIDHHDGCCQLCRKCMARIAIVRSADPHAYVPKRAKRGGSR